MSDVAIRAENLSKRYRIGERVEPYRMLRDSLSQAIAAPFHAIGSIFSSSERRSRSQNHIWALKDLSFEIGRGETVGVVGRNGAGKSTLLKVLSRITEPTVGYADVKGRVAALLEVGTGFHYELTGRENIYLSGSIMGMKRSEIKRNFDRIVDFAEIEKFIDTPVKHYSSGMYLRLAFSIAAHLEPDILLVDELLAVGDIAFQRKCLGKMEEVAAHGRTVLFVSHNLATVKELCRTCIVINKGQMDFRGPIVEGLACYSRLLAEEVDYSCANGGGWQNVRVNCDSGGLATIKSGEPFLAEALLDLKDEFAGGKIFLIINNSVGETVVHQRIDSNELYSGPLDAGRYHLRAELPALWLAPGVYTLYYKFMGRNKSSNADRYISERVILDVIGNVNGIGRATLAPRLRWALLANKSQDEEVVGFTFK